MNTFKRGDIVRHQMHGIGKVISVGRDAAMVRYPTSDPNKGFIRTHSILNLTLVRDRTPKVHWSRFGYTTICGKHLSGSRYLTRNYPELVTCKSCAKILGIEPYEGKIYHARVVMRGEE